MKIRSLSELNEYLDSEISWRKKELTAVKLMLGTSRAHEQNMILRAGICLLYAHWEGFVKNAATSFVTYVSTQGLRYCELTPNFIALCFRGQIKASANSNRPTVHTDLVTLLRSDLTDQANILPDTAIDTASNLNFDIFQEIMCILGLSTSGYLPSKPLIDERLVKNRNRVAHGQYLTIDEDDYSQLHSDVIGLIDSFRNDIENSAATNSYRLA